MLKLACFAMTLSLFLPVVARAGEKSLYDFLWLDPDKKVYVLQNKLFKKEHTFYADVGYGMNFTSKFQNTHALALRTGFYVHEEWAVELFYNRYTNSANEEYRNVRSLQVEPFIRRLNSSYGAIGVWSPFYGKINTFNQIFYFDWSFGAGVGMIDAASNRLNADNSIADTRFDQERYTGGILKTKVKFHLREHVHVGLEYFNTYYMGMGPQRNNVDPAPKLRINTDIVFSVGFSY
jgi:outer membrane beta-barrel protein